MDALLTALMGCLLGGMGDKSQLLALALAARFHNNRAVIAGAAIAFISNAVLAAIAGSFIGPMLGSQARLLFLALALLMLGGGMLWPVKPPDTLATWPTGPFLTSVLGLFILGFGDGQQFLILGIATRTADPAMAALGGALGMRAALIPAVLMRERLMAIVPLGPIRVIGALVMMMIGLGSAVAALGLVG